jgi:ferric-dicitrate binding protein FerR (iron transport regulator)
LKLQKDELKKLLEKPELTAIEMQWLLNYLQQEDNLELKQIMEEQFSNSIEDSPKLDKQVSDRLLEAIHEKITLERTKPKPSVISLKRFAAAAAILGIIILSAFLLINKNRQTQLSKAETSTHKFKDDVAPGGNKATLTLADGSMIVLDDAKNGTLTQQGASKVIKLDGKVLYDLASEKTKKVVYNTIATPKGGQYQLELPDGSLVWLNASSSIHFPTSFTEKDRRVEITGEAYFEVAKDASKPFIVAVNNSEVQVLGTHFNVNAYNDEEEVRTTLLEGSVKFVDGNNTSLLQPGQQSQLAKNGIVKVVSNVDVDEVMAWKNGLFSFENAGIETIMRQLSRWYDVEIEYKGKTDDIFVAEISRNIKLSDALKALELTGRVKFEIDGKKIVVMP